MGVIPPKGMCEDLAHWCRDRLASEAGLKDTLTEEMMPVSRDPRSPPHLRRMRRETCQRAEHRRIARHRDIPWPEFSRGRADAEHLAEDLFDGTAAPIPR